MIVEKVQALLRRREELESELSSPDLAKDPAKLQKLGREYTTINKNFPLFTKYLGLLKSIDETDQMIRSETDSELATLAREEMAGFQKQIPGLEELIKFQLVPRDPDDVKNAVVEIRAGTGGTEAGIFGANLFRMYTHFLDRKGWKIEVLSSSFGELGAVKEIIFMACGDNAYGTLKYESGVHRVQRVPETEAQGRVHTSAASVAVFPEADEVEVTIDPNDLRVDTYCASGHGGQSVNTTYSAVRIVHIPTGITVTCQDEKSQIKNKSKAMKVLQARLYEAKRTEVGAKEDEARRSMVSTGDRSAKIRTYNFPQNRMTDHRINLTLYSLDKIIDGDLQEMIDALAIADLNEKIKFSE
ncbi:MAG: peptide chain release factor 1 [Chitinispirillaceae bacterium]|jgi:peptide chain release factor 1|nr:peptide chain release factor 1 [Chitinispirillaceae bacterium]